MFQNRFCRYRVVNQTIVKLNISMAMYARGLPTLNSVSPTEPGDRFWVGGDAALGHWWGGDGFLLWIRQRREETSLGQDLHSICERAHTCTAVWHIFQFIIVFLCCLITVFLERQMWALKEQIVVKFCLYILIHLWIDSQHTSLHM